MPTWASVFFLTNSGRRLATGQLHVWVVALDVGVIGDNQSAGITVVHVAALDARERARNPSDLLSCDAPGYRICESAALRVTRGEASDAGGLPCSRSSRNY